MVWSFKLYYKATTIKLAQVTLVTVTAVLVVHVGVALLHEHDVRRQPAPGHGHVFARCHQRTVDVLLQGEQHIEELTVRGGVRVCAVFTRRRSDVAHLDHRLIGDEHVADLARLLIVTLEVLEAPLTEAGDIGMPDQRELHEAAGTNCAALFLHAVVHDRERLQVVDLVDLWVSVLSDSDESPANVLADLDHERLAAAKDGLCKGDVVVFVGGFVVVRS